MTAMYWVRWHWGALWVRWGELFGYSVNFRRGFSPAYVCSKFCWLRSHWCDLGVVFTDGRARCVECVPHDGRAGWLYDFFQLLFGDGATGAARPVDDCRALCCGKRVALRRSRGTGHSLGARL